MGDNKVELIDATRCVCNYMIVLLHAWAVYQYCTPATLEYVMWDYICNVIMVIALPTLFFISGYLLVRGFSFKTYPAKLMRRFKRLVVPYVIWNASFVVAYILLSSFVPRLHDRVVSFGLTTLSGVFEKIIDFSVSPIDGPLWFIRTLWIYSLAAPLFWFLGKYFKGYMLLIFSIGWLILSCFWGDEIYYSHTYPAYSLVTFSIGCIMQLQGGMLLDIVSKYKNYILAIGLIGVAIIAISHGWIPINDTQKSLMMFVRSVGLIFSMGLMFVVLNAFKSVKWMLGGLKDMSFFVYAGHFFFCSIPLHICAPILKKYGLASPTLLVCIFMVIGLPLCFLAYTIGKHFMGRIFKCWDGTL